MRIGSTVNSCKIVTSNFSDRRVLRPDNHFDRISFLLSLGLTQTHGLVIPSDVINCE